MKKHGFLRRILLFCVIWFAVWCMGGSRLYAATCEEADSSGYTWETDFLDGTGSHRMLNLPITDWKSSAPEYSTMGGEIGIDYIRQNGTFVMNPVTWTWSDINRLTMTNSNVWRKKYVNGKVYDITDYGDRGNYLSFYRYDGSFYIDPAYDMTGMNFAIVPVSESAYCYIDDAAYFFIYPMCLMNEIDDNNYMNYLVFWMSTICMWNESKYFHGVEGEKLVCSITGDAFQESPWWSRAKPANASNVVSYGYAQVKNRSDYDGTWGITIVFGGNSDSSTSYRYLVGAEFQTNQILYDGNGATEGENQIQYQAYRETVTIYDNWFSREGWEFAGWNDRVDGSGIWYQEGDSYSDVKPLTLFAQWKPLSYVMKVHHYKWSSAETSWEYVETTSTPAFYGDYFVPSYLETLQGYDPYQMEEANGWIVTGDKEVCAYYYPHRYRIRFDANGGTGEIAPVDVFYDDTFVFPDGSAYYTRYTVNGEVETGQEAATEDVGASVFLGWSFETDRYRCEPAYRAEESCMASDLIEAFWEQEGALPANGEIVLYANWDDCPWIVAHDLYYTLEQAQKGAITEDEILSHATASDREDGSPILPGTHEDGTSFIISDYASSDLTQFAHAGSVTENLTVTDSSGSVSHKQITIFVVDTTGVDEGQAAVTRFISEPYYEKTFEEGGLLETSIWNTNEAYRATLLDAFERERRELPVQTFYFTHEKILSMRSYLQRGEMDETHRQESLTDFYQIFMTEVS